MRKYVERKTIGIMMANVPTVGLEATVYFRSLLLECVHMPGLHKKYADSGTRTNIQGCIQNFQDNTCKEKFSYLGC